LNPEKCVFGVKAGKFLGFILTQWGIEMNLEKCEAILSMRSLTSVKEVQQLEGRMTSLSRFIPKEKEKEQRSIYFISWILQGAEVRYQKLEKAAKARWVEILSEVIWSFHMTVQSITNETPFSLVYGGDVVLPIELEVPSSRTDHFSEIESEEGRLFQLDTIDELRSKAKLGEAAWKRSIETKHLSKVHAREFREGDLVLRKAEDTEKDNKLASTWIGPYRVREVVGKRTYGLETLDGGGVPRTWNVANLRFYYN